MSEAQQLYERARRHGLSHDAALDCVAEGELRCWCGHEPPCTGGAQRFVGCPVMVGKPYCDDAPIQLRRGDAA